MKTYQKTKTKNWFFIERIEGNEIYTISDIREDMPEPLKKSIQKKIDNKDLKGKSQEICCDKIVSDKLQTILIDAIKQENLDFLIGASIHESGEGDSIKYSGIANLRKGDNHEQVRF